MILVFGKTGQVATELERLGAVVALDRGQADLSDPQACADAIRAHGPRAVINAAAYTAVDSAEDEEVLATVINGGAPTAMAHSCAELGVPLIHISTDYVFAGTGQRPWQPNDPTAPLNAYGRSKLAGEKGVISSGATYGILRTSWVVSNIGENFVKTMLRLSETRNELSIVNDQIGAPTLARDIAHTCYQMAISLIANPGKLGIYHFSGTPNVSWCDFAGEIFRQVGRNIEITPILSADYPTAAPRPLNSRLDCQDTLQQFGIKQPDWRRGLNDILGELGVLL